MKNNNSNLRISYGFASHGKEEEKRVLAVLREKRTLMGQEVKEFESMAALDFGKKHAVMVNSGSSANLLAVELMHLKPGDEVITPILTFATTVAPLVMKGLVPVFTDVIEGRYTLDESVVESLITKKTKALFIPLLLGNVPDVKKLYKIAKKHKLIVIQDSCDTYGATIDGNPVGKYADIITTSFYGSHIITAGGNGGMVLVDSEKQSNLLKMLRGWGRGSSVMQETEDIRKRYSTKISNISYDAKFIFNEIGYNFLPNEIGAAFGIAQLKKLNAFKKKREKNFAKLLKYFKKYEQYFVLPIQDESISTQWLAFPLCVRDDAPFTRLDIVSFLEKNNMQTRPIFTGNILMQPGFKDIEAHGVGKYPVAERIMKNGFLIGCHHGLTDVHIKRMTEIFNEFLLPFE